jgi:hypothetical protein
MHPRNELPEALAGLEAAADVAAELVFEAPAAGALEELLPQAASSRLVAAAAAVAIKAVCLTVSSRPDCRSPGVTGLPPSPDCPNVKPVNTPWEEARLHCGHVVAKSGPEVAFRPLDS